ncbi:hypothetical protein B1B04_25180 [Lysinibacillus sp. KCTC 33748]|uniref:hypothetical protein n=1 Tax=unclassified Lysinibacillus TaxID=2636778 RepID=UPI0009A72B32|nr:MULTISPECIES: hypothetical protein [unclassified Lysinibacillus]OXS65130.1 hypothetical protein B1B04_25180 [Lysinibacillus sp. KCTC 33748]SKC20237.1 hypothetical protein SAMN06295926_1553 [Lysinibacillus sp. AC-3]
MRIGYSHAEEYDRETDYWQDIEDAQNAQIEKQKNSQSIAVESESLKNIHTDSIARKGSFRTCITKSSHQVAKVIV